MKLPMLLDTSNGELKTHTGFELIGELIGAFPWVQLLPWGVSLLVGVCFLIVSLGLGRLAWYTVSMKGEDTWISVLGALLFGGVGLFILLSASYPF